MAEKSRIQPASEMISLLMPALNRKLGLRTWDASYHEEEIIQFVKDYAQLSLVANKAFIRRLARSNPDPDIPKKRGPGRKDKMLSIHEAKEGACVTIGRCHVSRVKG